MIRKLCEAHHLPREGELKAFVGEDAAGQVALCVGVIDGIAYAVDNACPHARAALAGGHLSGTNVVCPLHGWQWNIASGKPVHEGDPPICTYEIRQYGSEAFIRIPHTSQPAEVDEHKPGTGVASGVSKLLR